MTVFYFKWEEFFGAWLEMRGQSVLIVYGDNVLFSNKVKIPGSGKK